MSILIKTPVPLQGFYFIYLLDNWICLYQHILYNQGKAILYTVCSTIQTQGNSKCFMEA